MFAELCIFQLGHLYNRELGLMNEWTDDVSSTGSRDVFSQLQGN